MNIGPVVFTGELYCVFESRGEGPPRISAIAIPPALRPPFADKFVWSRVPMRFMDCPTDAVEARNGG